MISPEYDRVQFDLVRDNPLVKSLKRVMSAFAVVALPLVLGFFAAGNIGWADALVYALFATLGPAAAIWNIGLLGQGVAELNPTHLIVRTRGGRQVYRWEHIRGVRVTRYAERGVLDRLFARISGVDPNWPFVELRLKRSVRIHLWGTQCGTDVVGLPSIVFKTGHLYLEDPEGFVEQARRHLGRE